MAVAAALGPLLADPRSGDGLRPDAQWEIACGLRLGAMEVDRARVIRSDGFRTAAAVFDRVGVLVRPAARIRPGPVAWDRPREIAGAAMERFHRWREVVVAASLIGLPFAALPAGFGAAGLPMGLQPIGRHGSEARRWQIAGAWHEATR